MFQVCTHLWHLGNEYNFLVDIVSMNVLYLVHPDNVSGLKRLILAFLTRKNFTALSAQKRYKH